ncbi:MAG: hypothetical protein EHM17_11060 [Verrucomicrobiaceae bacterium]|nr:MAG: hypothetical protein EHM17_11060 [Verrucomicrobiaceae bacterium]
MPGVSHRLHRRQRRQACRETLRAQSGKSATHNPLPKVSSLHCACFSGSKRFLSGASSTIGQQALHRQGPLGFRPALLHIPDGHRFHGAWAKMFHAGANELNPAKYFKRPGMENPQIALEIVIFNQPSTVKIEKHPENGNF